MSALKATRLKDFNNWYLEVIKEADLAENSVVRGCMVIKPWGYAIWEIIQKELDKRIKETGHENAYFPLLIPKSFLEKEAEHIEGFAKECAVVTHHRLIVNDDGKLVPGGELTEPYIIRPTSETVIGQCYSQWIQSYRDLPIKINQWANVMRWEMRPRLFLRTSEFLWQEGHTAHATEEEAREEASLMHRVYKEFLEYTLAIPCFEGAKTPDEKFPGAVISHTLEVMSQNGKAIQAGTSHFLGQTFSKAFNIMFQNQLGQQEYAWTTSWGVTTRLIGALIMSHSDDDGLVLPHTVSPVQIWINLILDKGDAEKVQSYAQEIVDNIKRSHPLLRVQINPKKHLSPGENYWNAVKKGIPIVLEIGPLDVAKKQVTAYLRHEGRKLKHALSRDQLGAQCQDILEKQYEFYYVQAQKRLLRQTKEVTSLEDLIDCFKGEQTFFAKAHWHPDAMSHPLLKELQVTPRCLLPEKSKGGHCVLTEQPTNQVVIYAKSY